MNAGDRACGSVGSSPTPSSSSSSSYRSSRATRATRCAARAAWCSRRTSRRSSARDGARPRDPDRQPRRRDGHRRDRRDPRAVAHGRIVVRATAVRHAARERLPRPHVSPAIRPRARAAPEIWSNTTDTTYVLLPADGSLTRADLHRQLPEFAARHVPEEQRRQLELDFDVIPVRDLLTDRRERRVVPAPERAIGDRDRARARHARARRRVRELRESRDRARGRPRARDRCAQDARRRSAANRDSISDRGLRAHVSRARDRARSLVGAAIRRRSTHARHAARRNARPLDAVARAAPTRRGRDARRGRLPRLCCCRDSRRWRRSESAIRAPAHVSSRPGSSARNSRSSRSCSSRSPSSTRRTVSF